MIRNRIFFYATRDDLISILNDIEGQESLKYYRTGLFDNNQSQAILSLSNLSDLGHSSNGDSVGSATYIVVDRNDSLNISSVIQKNSSVKYSIDQSNNLDTIIFRPGRVFQGENLIQGEVGTISTSNKSLELFKIFQKAIKKKFSKIQLPYVGDEASKLLDEGWRLTAHIKSPTLYDLKR